MRLAEGAKPLVLVEEAGGSWQDLALVDTPFFNERVENATLFIQHLDCALLCAVLETHDTVRDAAAAKEADPAHLGSVVSVRAATGFGVDVCDVDDA